MKNLLFWPLGAALLLTGAALPGCNGPTTATEQAAPATPEAQAKAVHDTLMDRHDRLMDRDEVLLALAARLNAGPHPPRAIMARIGTTNNAMLDWMHQYQEPDSAAPAPQRLTYYQEQQRKLEVVEKQQLALLDTARTLVDKLPPNPNAGPAVPLPAPK